MAKKRKFCAYRRIERPYTRFSKYKKKSYVKMRPANRVVRFDMGNDLKEFQYTLELVSKASVQMRDAAIESARMSSNRVLENTLGKSNYKYKIMIFPHHVLRENPLAAGAGADRMSTGMAHAFGKIVGIAAQVKKGKVVAQLKVNKEHVEIARDALRRAASKLPCATSIIITENKLKLSAGNQKITDKEPAKK